MKELWISADDTPLPECGLLHEIEILYQPADGELESYYLVFPRSRGEPIDADTTNFVTRRDDAGAYGAFTRSGAFMIPGVTRYRLRATTYSGVRSNWGPLIVR